LLLVTILHEAQAQPNFGFNSFLGAHLERDEPTIYFYGGKNMKARSKKFLSLLLASAMVFTMNTTVFAEEVAIDSVDEVAVDTVDDAEGSVDYIENHITYDDKTDDVTSKITYNEDGTVTIEGVDNPVSWNGLEDYGYGKSYNNMASNLVYTVLCGSEGTDTSLVNDGTVTTSNNGSGTDVEDQNYYNKLRGGNLVYDVIDLGDSSHYLFVGYSIDNGTTLARVQGVEGYTPVVEFDGRQIDFDKSGLGKSTKSKKEALNVYLSLVKYEGTTLTEIPGVTVGSVKVDKKNAKNASVSGQMITEKYKYTPTGQTEQQDGVQNVYAPLPNATLPTFTISAKVKGKDVDKTVKKAIADKLKEKEYTFAIRQKVVDVELNNRYYIFGDEENYNYGYYYDNTDKVSTNAVFRNANRLYNSTYDRDEYDFDEDEDGNKQFTISKFNADKGTATIALNVDTWNGKKWGTAAITLKDGTDYEFTEGTVGGEKVKVLNFKEGGNFAYRWSATPSYNTGLATLGYKYAFRQTPATDTNKKPKTFREGIYKADNDGFVYNVED